MHKVHVSNYLPWSSKLQLKQTSFSYNFPVTGKFRRKTVLSIGPSGLRIVLTPEGKRKFKANERRTVVQYFGLIFQKLILK